MTTKTVTRTVLSEGTLSVPVSRPAILPEGIQSRYGKVYPVRGEEGRDHWYGAPGPVEQIRVSYKVLRDDAMISRMLDRAQSNRAGKSTRSGTTVFADGGAIHYPSNVPYMVKRAANATRLRMVAGPITVTVKLLEERTPYEPTCTHCKRSVTEHPPVQVETRGAWVGEYGAQDRRYDADAPRIDTYWLCPEA